MSKLSFAAVSILCASIAVTSVIAPMHVAQARTTVDQNKATEQKIRQAHARAMRDSSYVEALKRKNTEAAKAILVRNGAPESLKVEITGNAPANVKSPAARLTITVRCCWTIIIRW